MTQTGSDYNWNNPETADNYYAHNVAYWSCGYFLLDACLELSKGQPIFALHGILSFFTYFFTAIPRPFLQWHGMLFLLFELSTPAYNYRAILLHQNRGATSLFRTVTYTFTILFILARLVMGIPASIQFWSVTILPGLGLTSGGSGGGFKDHAKAKVAYFALSNLLLNGLNIYWGTNGLRKLFSKAEQARLGYEGAKGGHKTK